MRLRSRWLLGSALTLVLVSPAAVSAATSRTTSVPDVPATSTSASSGARQAPLMAAPPAVTSRSGSASTAARSTFATYPLSDTFAMHSDPGSKHYVYLDFDGVTVTQNSAWVTFNGMAYGDYAGWSLDGSPLFSDVERQYIQDVWRIVAEKYAPFNIDVTTEDPGFDGYNRTFPSDKAYGDHVAFSNDPSASAQVCNGSACVGSTFVGSFDALYDGTNSTGIDATNVYEPTWVFPQNNAGSMAYTAYTAVREIGSTLGLHEDGTTTGQPYFAGQGNWSPVMGAGTNGVQQFSKGEYTDANNHEDDMAVIQGRGGRLRYDDYGDTTAAAFHLFAASSYSEDGLIRNAADKDVFAIDRTCTGPLTASATGIGLGSALDIQLKILGSDGTPLATDDPPSGQDTSTFPSTPTGLDASATLPSADPGTYYVQVDGVGHGDPATDGYSDYGSVGTYHLDISGCSDPTGATPTAPASVTAAPAAARSTGGKITWTAPSSAGDSAIQGWRVSGLPGGAIDVSTPSLRTTTAYAFTPGEDLPISVAAYNQYGVGPATAAVLHIPTWAPTAGPTITTTVLPGKHVHLDYSKGAANPGNAVIAGYLWKDYSDGYLRSYGHPDPNDPTWEVYGVGRKVFQVTTTYASDQGLTTATSQVAFVIGPLPTPPARPTLVAARSGARGGPSTVFVRWRQAAQNGGAVVTQWRVRAYKLNAQGRIVQIITKQRPAVYPTWDVPLSPGRYKLKVIALNRVGMSPMSAFSSIVIAR